jgi:FKBP-type peptidyl-prolyl cis-trans isomerase SlyD
MKIQENSFVTVEYLLKVNKEETYPESGQPELISFCMGLGTMPGNLEDAILGMGIDEHKLIKLTPAEAYGEVDAEIILEVPRQDFDASVELNPGMIFETTGEDGHPAHFVIKEIKPETVVIDFNHPLAGKDLEVEITVREVREATPEDFPKEEPCSCCGSEHHHHD